MFSRWFRASDRKLPPRLARINSSREAHFLFIVFWAIGAYVSNNAPNILFHGVNRLRLVCVGKPLHINAQKIFLRGYIAWSWSPRHRLPIDSTFMVDFTFEWPNEWHQTPNNDFLKITSNASILFISYLFNQKFQCRTKFYCQNLDRWTPCFGPIQRICDAFDDRSASVLAWVYRLCWANMFYI